MPDPNDHAPPSTDKPDASPWSDPAPSPLDLHWRDGPLRRPKPRFSDVVPTFSAGYLGTVAAGAVFAPSLVAFFALLATVVSARFNAGSVAALVLSGLVATAVGLVVAAIAGVFVFPMVALVVQLAGLHRLRAVAASCAGGWTGFVAVQLLVGPDRDGSLLPFVAMAYGQIGAGWAARRTRRCEFQRRDAALRTSQFSLRQLLGLMAAIAILAAILASLPLPQLFWRQCVAALGLQLVAVAVYFLCTRQAHRFT